MKLGRRRRMRTKSERFFVSRRGTIKARNHRHTGVCRGFRNAELAKKIRSRRGRSFTPGSRLETSHQCPERDRSTSPGESQSGCRSEGVALGVPSPVSSARYSPGRGGSGRPSRAFDRQGWRRVDSSASGLDGRRTQGFFRLGGGALGSQRVASEPAGARVRATSVSGSILPGSKSVGRDQRQGHADADADDRSPSSYRSIFPPGIESREFDFRLKECASSASASSGYFALTAEEPPPGGDFSPDDADDASELLRAFGVSRRLAAMLGRSFRL